MTTNHSTQTRQKNAIQPNRSHLSLNDESFIHLAAVVLVQPEESIVKSLLSLRSKNKQRIKNRRRKA